MALRNIVTEKEARLRKVSRPVEKFDERLWTLLDDMADTMYEADGVGIAGVQVGVLRRVFVVDIGEGLTEFINPTITAQSGEQDGLEGCLSSPGEYGLVVRPEKVTIEAYDRHGKPFTLDAEGFMARAICHENDHLDGHIFKDITHHMLTDEELRELDEECEPCASYLWERRILRCPACKGSWRTGTRCPRSLPSRISRWAATPSLPRRR